ncbi:hypothetical protein CDD82_3577 [Ophiocordyceps australis]|uniref:Tubby C-terminal domain-containing protein n=1 Tax=Ophiocordyceps australis TaxID=1399860 RepID=A0A2C5ZC30_9HYPO|nr:hypothetical protein CDD82_3577 [Ophiocordyceps australis]
MIQLAPVQPPIGVIDDFIAPNTETLVIKEKFWSLSGDSFDIKLANGNPIFKVHGKHLTIGGRKSVSDMNGRHLFDIVKEHLHLHETYVIEDPNGKKILEIKNALLKVIGSKATAELTLSNGQTETLTMSGNWLDTSADIICKSTGATAARIDRKLINARELFGSQQTYALVVAPGVDMALMAAMCIALDEKNND